MHANLCPAAAFVVNHGCQEVEIWDQFLHHLVIQVRGRPQARVT
jgi:hypothetical protein